MSRLRFSHSFNVQCFLFPSRTVYEYLTKSTLSPLSSFSSLSLLPLLLGIHSSHPPPKLSNNDTLRRGTSIVPASNERPAPPIRRTPSMGTACHSQQAPPPPQTSHGYVELQSRLKARLQRAEEMAGQLGSAHSQKMRTVAEPTMLASRNRECPPSTDDDFPPPPPELLLSTNSKQPPSTTVHSTLLSEIQNGGFKLRKTLIEKDRSAPRL